MNEVDVLTKAISNVVNQSKVHYPTEINRFTKMMIPSAISQIVEEGKGVLSIMMTLIELMDVNNRVEKALLKGLGHRNTLSKNLTIAKTKGMIWISDTGIIMVNPYIAIHRRSAKDYIHLSKIWNGLHKVN